MAARRSNPLRGMVDREEQKYRKQKSNDTKGNSDLQGLVDNVEERSSKTGKRTIADLHYGKVGCGIRGDNWV